MSFTIIKLYADWCGHCIRMAPEWERLTSRIEKNKNSPEIVNIESKELYKLDEINSNLNEKVEVQGYPTIAKIKNGKITYYNGERDTNNMMKWIMPKSTKTNKTKKQKKEKRKKKRRKTKRKN